MPKKIRLILGDQLNIEHSWFKTPDQNATYVIMEVMQEQTYVKHHIQKIIGFFGAMRNFAHQLKKLGHNVIYITLDDSSNTQSITDNLNNIIKDNKADSFEYILPDEWRLDEQLSSFCRSLDISTLAVDSEHFITSRYEVRDFFSGKKTYLMETFYRKMRVRLGILMNGDEPTGGKWNFDADNRKKYDNKYPLPATTMFSHDLSVLKNMVDSLNVPYFGHVDAEQFPWPLSRTEALKALSYFCDQLLPHFGTYEDAMLQDHISLFHSRLSFALNTKMISPAEIIERVVATYKASEETIALHQIEGYIRQIIGWREFMRGVYWAQMPDFAKLNFFKNDRQLPRWFWDADTKMNCLHKCIGQSLDHAWAHHIQRLMVIGNFAMIAGFDPDPVDEWYLGVYIDAIQWVEITNTRGMSQFADGGIIGSKPYAGSAAYINKMSDYCKHCHYDPKKRHGTNACPFNSLYWDFYYRNREKLEHNHRIGMMYKIMDKFSSTEMTDILTQAETYLKDIDNL